MHIDYVLSRERATNDDICMYITEVHVPDNTTVKYVTLFVLPYLEAAVNLCITYGSPYRMSSKI